MSCSRGSVIRSLVKTISFAVAVTAAASSAHAQQSDLQLANVGPAEADYDADVAFDVSVHNAGPDGADAVLTNPVPSGMTFTSASSDWLETTCQVPAQHTSGTVTCSIAALSADATATIHLVLHIEGVVPVGTQFTDVASVSTTAVDPDMQNNTASAVVEIPQPAAVDLSALALGLDAAVPGAILDVAFGAANPGPGVAKHVAITAKLPAGIAFAQTASRGGVPAGYRCDEQVGDTVTCHIDQIGPGAQRGFVFRGRVPVDAVDGTTYADAVSITSDNDPNPDNNTATWDLCVQADNCAAGPCNSNVAVVCPGPPVQCQACDPASGRCESPRNAPCDDGDPCTQTDTCQSGVCSGGDPVSCPAAGVCEAQGVCDPDTGECAPNTESEDGSACDDHNVDRNDCTRGVCVAGVCTTARVSTSCGVPPTPSGAHDAGLATDAGRVDAGGTHVGGTDPGVADAATHDVTPTGTGFAGEGAVDTLTSDTKHHQRVDDITGGSPDAGSDAGADALPHTTACACRVALGAAARPTHAWWIALALLVAAGRRRKRRALHRRSAL